MNNRVVIIHAMAIVQQIKKTQAMKKMSDLSEVFIKKIERRSKDYSETHVIFDEYLQNLLKAKTRAKRATCSQTANLNYHINDNMSLVAVSIKDILSSTRTKETLTKYLADMLLKRFSRPLIVVFSYMR